MERKRLRIAPTFLPDIVLLDVMMPRPDGYEVCSQIKNDLKLRHSQVIMVSAKTDISERLRGYRAGADDYVTKPFEEEELLAKVCALSRPSRSMARFNTNSRHSAARRGKHLS